MKTAAGGGRGGEKKEEEDEEEVIREKEGDGQCAAHEPTPHFTRRLPFSPPFSYAQLHIQGRISEINKRKPFNLTPERHR